MREQSYMITKLVKLESLNLWMGNGINLGNQSGSSVALSSVGTRVAIGTRLNVVSEGFSAGHCRVYEYMNGSWVTAFTHLL